VGAPFKTADAALKLTWMSSSMSPPPEGRGAESSPGRKKDWDWEGSMIKQLINKLVSSIKFHFTYMNKRDEESLWGSESENACAWRCFVEEAL